jgi:PAS domain S-box-containing protein
VSPTRILVADDELVVARDIQQTLSELGYWAVGIAASGEEAVQKVNETFPDLILMHVRMPGGVDGSAAAEVVKTELDIPILFLTGFSDADTVEPAMESRPSGSSLEPFRKADLQCAIEIALHARAVATAQSERERLLSTALDSIGDGVVVTDADAQVMFLNRMAEQLTGWTTRDAAGHPLSEVLLLRDSWGGAVLENPISRAMEAGRVTRLEDGISLVRSDGSLVPIADSAAPIFDDRGGTRGGVMVFREITQQPRSPEEIRRLSMDLERRITERTAQLEESNKELEGVSSSVSYDLRGPLRSIDGFSKAMLQDHGAGLDAAARDHLRRVRAATQRMDQLIDNLLSLSRVSRTTLRRTMVDLSAIATEAGSHLARAHGGRIVELLVAEGALAAGDAGLVRIALENLLGNAWKFTSRRPAARIELGFTDAGLYRTFFVRDNGTGFDMARATRLFTPFERLHRADEFEGAGIGLATVQRIACCHGGRVWAEAEEGRGATFYFTLAPGPEDGPGAGELQRRTIATTSPASM